MSTPFEPLILEIPSLTISRMTVCLVNFAHLDPPFNGGVSRLAREVALGLLNQTPPSIRITFVVKMRFANRFKRWLGIQRNIILIPYSRHLPSRFVLQLVRPGLIVSPLFGVEPFVQVGSTSHIVSIPDTLPLDHPELFSAAEAQARQQSYQYIASAARTITLSKYSRDQLLRHLPLNPEQVQIVELGADGLPPPSPKSLINAPYIFYPANTWIHKRHELLLQTMALIWQVRPELKLVLSGGRPPNVNLNHLLSRYAPEEAVIDLGYVSEEKIATLYHHAEALMFTSQYEGFGMPVLEAMHAGCPVLCAPVTSLPEVAGDGALYVPSNTPEAWAKAFLEQLPEQRTHLIQRSQRQAAKFTWKQTRRKWVEAVLSVAGGTFSDG
jgi:glycosyltransferase involved in cell wall biosynthesis